jgi:hypothetical protein
MSREDVGQGERFSSLRSKHLGTLEGASVPVENRDGAEKAADRAGVRM